ncbi:hypothetical protein [Kocuria arenosa]|uniref:hypothetical protein n=1 Tax=Kocuria arenosa TaxID=3071446 RepID=UPI0034D77903
MKKLRSVYVGLLVILALVMGAAPAAAAAKWFNATNGQISDTGWPVSNPETTKWAQAARAGHGFCEEREYVGGFLNGHYFGNRKGVVCVNAKDAKWFNATTGQLEDTGWPVPNPDTVDWAQAARAAHGFCAEREYAGGFLNGHHFRNRKGVVCVGKQDAQWFDATNGQLLDTGWPVNDVGSVTWAQGARAAHGFCEERGFVGGFMNGHQLGNRKGVVCLR